MGAAQEVSAAELITNELVEKGYKEWQETALEPGNSREAFFAGIIFSQLIMAHVMGKQEQFMAMLDNASPTLQ